MRDRTAPMFFAPFATVSLRLLHALGMLAVLYAVLSLDTAAQAQQIAPHQPPPAALEGYNRGRALYQAGRYREAVVELERALALDPTSPNLVYNVARVYELLGELDEAVSYYERYIAMLPRGDTEERQRVTAIVSRLQGARDQVQREATNPPSESLRNPVVLEPVAAPRRGVADTAFWVTTGIGTAGLIAGASLGMLALRAEKKVDDFVVGPDGSEQQRTGLVDKADRLALSSDLLLLVGATLTVSGLLLYTLRERPKPAAQSKPRARLAAGASPHGFMLTVGASL